MHASLDFPNKYKDVVVNYPRYKIKEWIDWADVHARVMLKDLVIGEDYVFTELLHRMHRAAVHFTKSSLGRFSLHTDDAFKAEMAETENHW